MMDKQAHAVLLRDFFCTLFEPDETVYLYPGLSDKMFKEFSERRHELSFAVHGRELTFCNIGKGILYEPHRFLPPFQRKASSTETKVLQKLYDFADMGYDIYFCINPLTCSIRSQKTVHTARHIVLEADHADIETQKAIFEDYKDYFSAMVFSGNRSIHAYAKIDPGIPNYDCVGWRRFQSIRQNRQKAPAPLPEYDALARIWLAEMAAHGLELDAAPATDYARLTRVPGFKHSATHQPAEVWFLNPKAIGSQILMREREWESNPEAVALVSEDETLIDYGSPALAHVSDNILETDTPTTSDLSPYNLKETGQVYLPVYLDLPTFPLTQTPILSEESYKTSICPNQKKGTTETNYQHQPRFSDHLQTFYALKRDGIPHRGLRRDCHIALFISSRILGWDKTRMAEEWKAIVSKYPENIGLTPDEAVKQLLDHYEAKQEGSISLPNTLTLPIDPTNRLPHLIEAVKGLGCPVAKDVAHIISKVLWRYVRVLPIQCGRGEVGVKARDCLLVCNRGQYQPALAWMADQNILRVTDPNYINSRKTRRYFVNIPLILYLMGFRAEELDWSRGQGRSGGVADELRWAS